MDNPFYLPVEFSSNVTDFVKFGDVLLVRLENGDMYSSADGKHWDQFLFKLTGKTAEAPDRG